MRWSLREGRDDSISICIPIAFMYIQYTQRKSVILLVVPEEDPDRQPAVATDLEAVLEIIQLLDLVFRQLPPIQLEVAIDTCRVDRLGDDTAALLNTPQEQNLLGSLALFLSQLQKGRVLVERGVGRSQAGVARRVDALRCVVCDQLGGGVVRMELDLVDSGNYLAAGVVEKSLEVLDSKVGNANVPHLASGRELLHLLPVTSVNNLQSNYIRTVRGWRAVRTMS